MRKLKRLFRPLRDPRASNTRHDLVDDLAGMTEHVGTVDLETLAELDVGVLDDLFR